MKQQIWFGYSQSENRVVFYNSDPGNNSSLKGTGTFSVNGDVTGLNIEQSNETPQASQSNLTHA